MLYLNELLRRVRGRLCHLTLTNVVFEYVNVLQIFYVIDDLTLTNVVFEFC